MIKLYSAKNSDFTQADYTQMYSLLDCDLKQKIDQKALPQSKACSLCGYILLYRGVYELFGKKGLNITFNQNGKPLCDLCFFNISHSLDRVVCVISDEVVGVDIQKIEKIKKREKYMLFTDKESAYVNSDNEAISIRYIEIFTKKEAALKMLGAKLSEGALIDTFSNDFVFDTHSQDGFIITVCRKNKTNL